MIWHWANGWGISIHITRCISPLPVVSLRRPAARKELRDLISPTLIVSDKHKTRGNGLRLQKSPLKYDMRKFYFTDRVVDQWNSLANWVVTANNTEIFKNELIDIGNIRILYLTFEHK